MARVRELENIRHFLTGPALMSVLDLAFTFVFIAVMWYYSVTLTLVVLASVPLYAVVMGSAMPAFRRRLSATGWLATACRKRNSGLKADSSKA